MLPQLQLGPVAVPTYAIAVVAGFLVGGWIRSREVARLGYDRDPRHAWVGLGGLLGAVVGAKLGVLLFAPWSTVAELLTGLWSLDFTGKTVVGGIGGGYLGVELVKWLVGIRHSTGDGFALALPVGQAIGRLGCFFHGCCWGREADLPWSVHLHDALRHPTPLYEAGLDLLLAAAIASWRGRDWPAGHLFRRYLVGYAAIRFALDPLRGDAQLAVGPLTALQWACLAVMLGFGALIVRGERGYSGSSST